MSPRILLPALIASMFAFSSPGVCAEFGGLLERVSSPDLQAGAVKAAEVPSVPAAREVKLTPEQEALLIEASMTLEDDMVEDLRKQAAEWTRTNPPEKVSELLRARILELAGGDRYKSLFGDSSTDRLGYDQTVSAFQSRALPNAAPVQRPSRQQIVAALSAKPQDSAEADSAKSAEEVYQAHKVSFVRVCQKFSDVDQQGLGFPRAILGILRAETNFGQGCDRSRSGSCGQPSPVSKAMNGAQRNAAFRIDAKGMFGPWKATTAPASSAGAAGICQFLPGTAEMHLAAFNRHFGEGAPNLFSFNGCIPMIALYLKDYLDNHQRGSRSGIENAIRAYNGGAGFNANNQQVMGYHEKVVNSMRAQTAVPQTCREVLESAGR